MFSHNPFLVEVIYSMGYLLERFDDIIGVSLYADRPVNTILLGVGDHSKDYVATKPLHELQTPCSVEKEAELRQQYPTLEVCYFSTIDCVENYELIHEQTSFGAELEVFSPEEVRRCVIQRIEEIYQACLV